MEREPSEALAQPAKATFGWEVWVWVAFMSVSLRDFEEDSVSHFLVLCELFWVVGAAVGEVLRPKGFGAKVEPRPGSADEERNLEWNGN